MVQQLLAVFPPMLLGAQLILTLILVKGDICPGQRGRIHKLLPVLAVMWLAVASLRIEAMIVVFAISYFYSQVQTKKTRVQGPLWVLYLANGLALSYVAIGIGEQPDLAAGISVFVQIILLGALFAHLLLTVARTRLQAFHRILPVTGVISAMLMSLVILLKAIGLEEVTLTQATQPLLIGFALLITSVLIWSWHIIVSKTVNKVQLAVALLTLVSATTFSQGLFVL
ncbi:hypothetical protein [Vibrio neptunius]|uniref:Yip1 domain-containing protein n=1 Tax=Vibrio neptunius TaxID=170651 RepID=A0ABS2ZYI0_9VIBR|nr:hypothetical protein [Vibrio neptunius]MBN3492758.1 hypothetical protein [Vibrio neptunius]MBN3515255.1 hypothetical protein [Vibrio neptunius]MBN3548869.1 hypothetical protein [Vibrio neptunius]MBN3577331.1 hypothetical protein [Vibrio neptunius]MCH9870995.1 hypothetical protein [Vibrio neptunius]